MNLKDLFGRKMSSAQAFVDGLNAIIMEDYETAENRLLEVVKEDTENLYAYYHLAELFRRSGKYARAEKLYNGLLIRKNLDRAFMLRLHEGLVHVYIHRNNSARAVELLESLTAKHKNERLLRQLCDLYERRKDWENAFRVNQKLQKVRKNRDVSVPAMYRVMQGKELLAKDPKAARYRFREAIKINPRCVEAYLQYGMAYIADKRFDDALSIWTEFVRKIPRKSFIVFRELEKIYFESGSYGAIEGFYKRVLELDPENSEAMLALARHYAKMDRVDEAVGLCKRALEIEPASKGARHLLIKFLSNTGDIQQLLKTVKELINLYPSSEDYVCSECGHKVMSPRWHCPQCGAWESFNV